jgi:hypothetical protein
MLRQLSLLFIAIAALPCSATANGVPARRAFNEVVDSRIQPQVGHLVQQLVQAGRSMQIDGTPVFSGADMFLPGKIALAFSDLISTLPPDDRRLPRYLADFRTVAKLTVDDPNDSWGIYYYLSALSALNRDGRLKAAVDRATLAKLRVRLDWRTFVDVDSYELIEHPNNYYCVAFAIARLRHKLGWEDASGSERLYTAMASHYEEFSAPYGFADETDGEGRFDRYSILLAGEIAQRFIETGDTPPSEITGWLRKSADVMMMRLNPAGEGFEYGRSIGPYGETAIIEVLTAAAVLGILDDNEKMLAYTYASRAAERYADFWLDAATGSVNMWDQGRRTDRYRGKFRILGENLSLGHQYLYTNALWNRIGYQDKVPMKDFDAALKRLPQRAVTWLARGEYDRLLLTLRDRGRIISLPLINGGVSQHMNSPYFPIPFSPGMLAGIPDSTEPLLVPRFDLEDGTALMPLAYFRDVKVKESGRRTQVSYHQNEMDRMGRKGPVADDRIAVSTTYVFEPGSITRTDVYTPKQPVAVKGIVMVFGSYSAGTSTTGPGTTGLATRFSEGRIREFQVSGLDSCEAGSVTGDPRYQTPTGPLASKLICTRGALTMQRPITISWKLRYQPD